MSAYPNGHTRALEPRGERTPRSTYPEGWDLGCSCGWLPAVRPMNRKAAVATYLEHLADARANGPYLCGACSRWKPGEEMVNGKARHYCCKECQLARTRAWAEANPDEYERQRRDSTMRRKYGIGVKDWDALYEAQHGRCAICQLVPEDPRGYRGLHVDHDHATGLARQLLCYGCNTGLGAFGDSPERLVAAIEYLRQHGKNLASPLVSGLVLVTVVPPPLGTASVANVTSPRDGPESRPPYVVGGAVP